ncbi:MAG TPA: GNAT family N-acetyltransferase [Micromonosporaceae bacterium]
MSEYVIETASDDDWDALIQVVENAFHEEHSDAVSATERIAIEIDRTLVARRDGEIVGSASIQTRHLAVPGAVVPAAHVTLVSVATTARRRGILTGFMRRQFDDARAAGEPVAVLFASEGRIYQRFGYGLAATRLGLTIDTTEAKLTVPAGAGRIREASPQALRDEMAKLFDEVFAARPGWSERASRHWDYRLADPKEWRRGANALRAVVHENDGGEVDGYALWRTQWPDSGPYGEVRVVEQVAANPDAYNAIWAFLMAVDLTRSVNVWLASSQEPLIYAVSDPRRLEGRFGDAVWLRVLDVPAALAARRYAADLDIVIEVTDSMLPSNAGRWRLTGSPAAAACVSTVDAPDLTMDVRALGAAYLGGTPLSALAATGQVVEHTAGAIARADAALRWHVPPAPLEVF